MDYLEIQKKQFKNKYCKSHYLHNRDGKLKAQHKYREKYKTRCPCGGSYVNRPSGSNIHFKTIKHQKYINENYKDIFIKWLINKDRSDLILPFNKYINI